MDKDRFERGLQIRKEVLGEEYVQRALDNADDYNRDFQEQIVTELGWGASWGRGGLDRKYRSVLNLGMLAAMGRFTEFESHFRGAMNNGLTRDELKEVLFQISVYCGVPTGIEAFRCATRVLEKLDADGK